MGSPEEEQKKVFSKNDTGCFRREQIFLGVTEKRKVMKMTLYKLIEACSSANLDTSRLRIMVYVMEHTNLQTNEFCKSYDDIARETETSYSVVAKTMKMMQDEGLIGSRGKGRWKWLKKMFESGPVEEGLENQFSLYLRNYGK